MASPTRGAENIVMVVPAYSLDSGLLFG